MPEARNVAEDLAEDVSSGVTSGIAEDAVPGAVAADEQGAEAKPATAPPRPWQPVVRRFQIPILVATVALEVLVVARLGMHWSTLPVALFASTAVVLSAVDFAVLRLPNIFTEPTGVAVFAALVLQALAEHRPHHLLGELYSGLAVAAFYQLLRLLSRGGLGVGDVKVGAVAAALLAARGVQSVFDGVLAAYVVTLAVALVLLARRRKQFPFGPGILLGALFVLLV